MLYELEQGPYEKTILEQARRNKMPVPEAILNRPQLSLGLELYYRGFHDLSSTRPVGMAPGEISWLSIVEYCAVYEIDDLDQFIYFIKEMDAAYLKYSSARTKSTASKPTKPVKRR